MPLFLYLSNIVAIHLNFSLFSKEKKKLFLIFEEKHKPIQEFSRFFPKFINAMLEIGKVATIRLPWPVERS